MINREISNKILTVGCEYHPPPPYGNLCLEIRKPV